MNISIHLHGTPRGYELYPADGNEELFRRHLFEKPGVETSFIIERRGALVHYTIVYHGLDAVDGEHHASLALSLTLNSVLCKKPEALFRIMDDRLKRILLFRGKVIATIEQDRVGFLTTQLYEYQTDIEALEKAIQQDIENKLSQNDWLSLRENFQGESLDTPPAVFDWSMGEEWIVERCFDTPFIVLQSSEVVDSLYASSLLLRKRRRKRRIVNAVALTVGLLIGVLISLYIKPKKTDSPFQIEQAPNTWSSKEATDLKAPHWAIIEPLNNNGSSYNVYFLRYTDPEHWICEKVSSDFSFGKNQEHKVEKTDKERELITGCNNMYTDITQKRIRVVIQEREFTKLDEDYKERLEKLFGKIIKVPEDWIRNNSNTTIPWQITYPIKHKKLI